MTSFRIFCYITDSLEKLALRDYSSNANVQVYIFSDRVEITNPGGLPPGMSYSDLGKKSMPRNFLLFGLMQRMGLVEKVGTGILRMKNAMKEYDLSGPRFDINDNWFTIIFDRPTERWVEKWLERWYEKWLEKGLTRREIEILTEIKKDMKISIKKLSDILGIYPSAVQKHIDKLKKKGSLERVGPAKGGYWRIIEDGE